MLWTIWLASGALYLKIIKLWTHTQCAGLRSMTAVCLIALPPGWVCEGAWGAASRHGASQPGDITCQTGGRDWEEAEGKGTGSSSEHIIFLSLRPVNVYIHTCIHIRITWFTGGWDILYVLLTLSGMYNCNNYCLYWLYCCRLMNKRGRLKKHD